MGKAVGIIVAVLIVAIVIFFGVRLIDVDQTREANLPDVDVDVSADSGNLPEYDVDTGEVVVGTQEEEVKVPKVVMEEEEVDVPVVGIKEPEDDKKE